MSALGLGLSDFAVLEVIIHNGPRPVNVTGKQSSTNERLHNMEETMTVFRSGERTELVRLQKVGMWAAVRLESDDGENKS
jgi:hypothetical protein